MSRRPPPLAPDARAGFVLPSVLFVVAMLTLVFLVAIQSLNSLAEETRRATSRVQFEQSALSLEAQAAFLAATRPLAPAAILQGWAPTADTLLALDGRPYVAAPNLTLSVQDEGGLINLNALTQPAMANLFAALGANAAWRPVMVDRLSDYMDADDIKRPNGAEADDYLRAGLPPPPNAALRRRDQVIGVMGWREAVPSANWRGFRDNVTADPVSVAVNVNTAPAAVLEVLYGLSPAQASAAIARREAAPFTTLEELGHASGVALVGDADRVYTFPNGRFALRVQDRASGWAYRSRLLLSPEDSVRPFWVVEPAFSALSATEKAPVPAHAAPFPDPAA
jgi:type II secretory pathway component PulK